MDEKIYKIIYTADFIPKRIHISLFEFGKALGVLIKAKSEFYRGKSMRAIHYLKCIAKGNKNIQSYSKEIQIYNARRVVHTINTLLWKYRRKPLCLEHSICLCAALISIGFSVDLIIGKALNYTGTYCFHSWLEIDGVSINDRINYYERYHIVSCVSF